MGPGDEALSGLPAGNRAAGGVCALGVPRQGEHGWPCASHSPAGFLFLCHFASVFAHIIVCVDDTVAHQSVIGK